MAVLSYLEIEYLRLPKNLKKFKLSSLSYKSKYTQIFFKKSRNTTNRWKGERIWSDRRGDLLRTYQRRTQRKKKKPETERQRNLDRSAWVTTHRAAWPGSRTVRSTAWVLLSLFLGFFFFFLLSLGSSGFFFELYKVYKSSLRDSIFMCSRGKICHVRND